MDRFTNAKPADKLRALRALANQTQSQAAQRLGTSRQRVAAVEAGAAPTRTLALAIEAAYGIPADAWGATADEVPA